MGKRQASNWPCFTKSWWHISAAFYTSDKSRANIVALIKVVQWQKTVGGGDTIECEDREATSNWPCFVKRCKSNSLDLRRWESLYDISGVFLGCLQGVNVCKSNSLEEWWWRLPQRTLWRLGWDRGRTSNGDYQTIKVLGTRRRQRIMLIWIISKAGWWWVSTEPDD